MKIFLLVLSAILIFSTFIFAQSEPAQTEQETYSESVSAKPVREIEPYRFKKNKKKKDSKQKSKKVAEEIAVPTDEMIVFPVSVYDRNGDFIEGLKESDFIIYENGSEQKLEYFNNEKEPATIVFVIDTSASTNPIIKKLQSLLDVFINQLNSQHKIVITELGEKFDVLNDPTSDRKELSKGFKKLRYNRGTSIYDGISELNEKALKRISGQKVVVFLTDGVDTTSQTIEYLDSLRIAEETNTAFFPIYYNSYIPADDLINSRSIAGGNVVGHPSSVRMNLPNPNTWEINQKDRDLGKQYLEELAAFTGGKVIKSEDGKKGLENAFIRTAEEIRNLYFVGYRPQKTETGEREIKVRINRPNLTIFARGNYFSGQQ